MTKSAGGVSITLLPYISVWPHNFLLITGSTVLIAPMESQWKDQQFDTKHMGVVWKYRLQN